MRRYLRLYWTFLKYNLIHATIYRGDFFAWSLVTIGWVAFTLVFYQILFTQVTSVGGWNRSQMLILQGFYFWTEAVLWGLVYENLHAIPRKINRGTLDLDLVKPVNLQFLLSVRRIGLDHLNSVVLGALVMGYALQSGRITPSLTEIMIAISLFAIATIFLYAAWFTTVCLAFWVERLENIVYVFPAFRHFAKLPLPAYQGTVRAILTYIIPIALVTTLPTQSLLGRLDIPAVLVLGAFALGSLALSRRVLQSGLKRYTSASG